MGETRGGGGNKKPSSKNNGRKFRSRGKKSGKSLSQDEGETEHLGEESTKRRDFSCTPCTNLKNCIFFTVMLSNDGSKSEMSYSHPDRTGG